MGAFAAEGRGDSDRAFVERYGLALGRQQGTGSGGLRDRLARYDVAGVDQLESGRQRHQFHDERDVERQLFLWCPSDRQGWKPQSGNVSPAAGKKSVTCITRILFRPSL